MPFRFSSKWHIFYLSTMQSQLFRYFQYSLDRLLSSLSHFSIELYFRAFILQSIVKLFKCMQKQVLSSGETGIKSFSGLFTACFNNPTVKLPYRPNLTTVPLYFGYTSASGYCFFSSTIFSTENCSCTWQTSFQKIKSLVYLHDNIPLFQPFLLNSLLIYFFSFFKKEIYSDDNCRLIVLVKSIPVFLPN